MLVFQDHMVLGDRRQQTIERVVRILRNGECIEILGRTATRNSALNVKRELERERVVFVNLQQPHFNSLWFPSTIFSKELAVGAICQTCEGYTYSGIYKFRRIWNGADMWELKLLLLGCCTTH